MLRRVGIFNLFVLSKGSWLDIVEDILECQWKRVGFWINGPVHTLGKKEVVRVMSPENNGSVLDDEPNACLYPEILRAE
jgi:hypothetical protein